MACRAYYLHKRQKECGLRWFNQSLLNNLALTTTNKAKVYNVFKTEVKTVGADLVLMHPFSTPSWRPSWAAFEPCRWRPTAPGSGRYGVRASA
eukprot:4396565-Pleurochrysis_carterae.AAC.1